MLLAYVDTNLVGSNKVTRALILGQQGGVWASSPGFEVRGDDHSVQRRTNSHAALR